MKFAIQMALLGIMLAGCKKAKVEKEKMPVTPPISKWALISGDYKVYDTAGVFLYDMSISHSKGQNTQGIIVDSLHFTNFDGNFNISASQSAGCPNYCTRVGSHTAISDSINNRWNIFGMGSGQIYNYWHDDTIVMYFQKHNTPYWINDGTSYSNKLLKHVAVKQH
jgi:hypothetical protein